MSAHRCVRCLTEYDEETRWCWSCGSMDTVLRLGRRPRAALDEESEVATARELVAQTWSLVDWGKVLPGVQLRRGAMVLLVGPPGSGKSTLALELANLSQRPVVVLSMEERLGPTVGERLSRLGIHRSDLYVVGRSTVDAAVQLVRKVRAAVVVLDSVQAGALLASDVRSLVTGCGLDAAVCTAQVNKQGELAGARVWLHEADLVVQLGDEPFSWTLVKSRYGPVGLKGKVTHEPLGADVSLCG